MVKVKFRCGKAFEMDIDKTKPKCPECGASAIGVLNHPMPRIVGHGRGPLVQSKALEPIAVKLAPKGALKLKPKESDDARAIRN